MEKIDDIDALITSYQSGKRYFMGIVLKHGEKLTGLALADVTFRDCAFSADFTGTNFSNTKFIDCNLKGSDFTDCNLTDTLFDDCYLEETSFKGANLQTTVLTYCTCYDKDVYLNKRTKEIAPYEEPMVEALYNWLPEFYKRADHDSNELSYFVYGNLSNILYEDILINPEPTEFTVNCFKFFNFIGDRKEDEIDNLLIVGIYEGLYANKKCNDVARQLLSGRNKEVYEYWMINGLIQADY